MRPSFPPAPPPPRPRHSPRLAARFASLLSTTNSMKQKKRGAGATLATRIPTSSPGRPRAPPLRRVASAISLADQFPQRALLALRRRALSAPPGSQEFQKQLLEIELLAARRAVLQMLPDLALDLGRQLAIQEFIEVLDALTAIHAGLPLI